MAKQNTNVYTRVVERGTDMILTMLENLRKQNEKSLPFLETTNPNVPHPQSLDIENLKSLNGGK
jgi:hypothetical protein